MACSNARDSLLHLAATSAAYCLLPAAAAPPGPSVSIRPKRLLAWQRTVITPKRRLKAAIATALSPSSLLRCPLRPKEVPAVRTRHVASASSSKCAASVPHFENLFNGDSVLVEVIVIPHQPVRGPGHNLLALLGALIVSPFRDPVHPSRHLGLIVPICSIWP